MKQLQRRFRFIIIVIAQGVLECSSLNIDPCPPLIPQPYQKIEVSIGRWKTRVTCLKHFEWVQSPKFDTVDFQCTKNGWVSVGKDDGEAVVNFESLQCKLQCGRVLTRNESQNSPWHVSIFGDNKYICDGSLISPNGTDIFVLTAGHCIKKIPMDSGLDMVKIVVGASSNTIDGSNNGSLHLFEVTGCVIHPKYMARTRANDLAILRVDINPSDFILPACLPIPSNDDEAFGLSQTTCSSIKGTRGSRMPLPLNIYLFIYLLKISIPSKGHYIEIRSNTNSITWVMNTVANDECNSTSKRDLTVEFCAQRFNDSEACFVGSRGSGLISPTLHENSELFTILGVMNDQMRNLPCGFVYTKVSRFIDWIKSASRNMPKDFPKRKPNKLPDVKTKGNFSTWAELFPATITTTEAPSVKASGKEFDDIFNQSKATTRDYPPKVESSESYLVPLCVVAIIFILYISLSTIFWKVYVHRQEKLTKRELAEFLHGGAVSNSKPKPNINADIQAIPYDADYEINESELQIEQTVLGSGNFSVVFQGIYKTKPVAVKTLKADMNKEYLFALLSELKVMMYLQNHTHLVSLIGANTKLLTRGSLYIIVDLCPLGNLKNYLESHRDSFEAECFDGIQMTSFNNENNTPSGLSIVTLLKWAYQISAGMEYLQSKKVVHADLATRNVLLTEDQIAKVSDFGMSRQLTYDQLEYVKKHQEPMPWRWMAPESLQRLNFSSQSDVWSYAVTLWEMFTLGDLPYPGLSYRVDFPLRLAEGLRLYKPPYAPTKIYDLMKDCWSQKPEHRPCFSKIKTNLMDVWNRHSNLEEYTHLEFS